MKLHVIINPEFGNVFNKLMACKRLKGHVAFKLAKLAHKIKEDGEIYEKLRIEACQEYCERDPEGNPMMDQYSNFKIPQDKVPELNARVQEMLNVDIEFEKFSLQDFENAELSGNEFVAITELIKE